ncbi:HAD family hydrolase [Microcella sp.]|uniref:HAD family hydrolase n=1 Tax=Microcella sp. TaxID=1913979 RepID=UPI00391C88D1
MSGSPIEVVLFDLDDTLMAHTRAVDEAIALAQSTAGGAFAADDTAAVQRRWAELEERHYARYLTGELTYLGQRVARARDLMAPYGVEVGDDEALTWFERYLVGYRDAWRLFDDVLPALDALPPVRVGIITNGDLAFQTDKLSRIGLWDRLDLTAARADGSIDEPARRGRVIASGELGVTKPDRAIFHAAARAFEVEPAQCAYVGDRVRTDAVGAHEAGMLGIWLDRGRDRNPLTDRAEGDAPAGVPSIPNLLALSALLTR